MCNSERISVRHNKMKARKRASTRELSVSYNVDFVDVASNAAVIVKYLRAVFCVNIGFSVCVLLAFVNVDAYPRAVFAIFYHLQKTCFPLIIATMK